MRWLLRPPRAPLHLLALLARLAPYRIPLLLLLLASAAEVYLHARRLAVRQPAHDTDPPFRSGCAEPAVDAPRESAALVMLARNADLPGALRSIASVERHFNQWFHYPFVFLNDEPWDGDFVAAASAAVSGGARFEVVPKEEWTFPAWVDVQDARRSIAEQGRWGVMYGGKESYHHMCRFFSGWVVTDFLSPTPFFGKVCLVCYMGSRGANDSCLGAGSFTRSPRCSSTSGTGASSRTSSSTAT